VRWGDEIAAALASLLVAVVVAANRWSRRNKRQ
jgi:hypothetical protein